MITTIVFLNRAGCRCVAAAALLLLACVPFGAGQAPNPKGAKDDRTEAANQRPIEERRDWRPKAGRRHQPEETHPAQHRRRSDGFVAVLKLLPKGSAKVNDPASTRVAPSATCRPSSPRAAAEDAAARHRRSRRPSPSSPISSPSLWPSASTAASSRRERMQVDRCARSRRAWRVPWFTRTTPAPEFTSASTFAWIKGKTDPIGPLTIIGAFATN
jgi:hypothetical protein